MSHQNSLVFIIIIIILVSAILKSNLGYIDLRGFLFLFEKFLKYNWLKKIKKCSAKSKEYVFKKKSKNFTTERENGKSVRSFTQGLKLE